MNNYPPEFYTEVLKHEMKEQTPKATKPVVESFDQSTKLILALQQLDNVSSLVRGNEYEDYLINSITKLRVELQRQYNVLHNINAYV